MNKRTAKYIVVLFLLVLINISSLTAQTRIEKIEACNDYLDFLNESVHGLLIAHRLMENYNQSINKYVDLEGYQLNFYANSDLPTNIFEDPDNWFYEVSPIELYEKVFSSESGLSAKEKDEFNSNIKQIKDLLNRINSIRFDVENYIGQHDLNNKEELYKVYEMLEECVDMYDTYYRLHKSLSDKIFEGYGNIPNSSPLHALYNSCQELRNATARVLRALRDKEDNNIDVLIKEMIESYARLKKISTKSYSELSNLISQFDQQIANIERKTEEAIQAARLFYGAGDVPEEYKLYGKYYYYHNSNIINKFNRYGNGFVFEMNQMFEDLEIPFLKFAEVPHFYQVIYPKRLDTLGHISSMDPFITSTPRLLREREIIQSDRIIYADSALFEIKLYDHMLQDGDIVSINFNGDWILDKYSIEAKAKILKLKLNESGKNYILLHAENMGKRPPNTMAIKYTSKGKEEEIVLKADMETSEVIEIVLGG